jgi:HSP20 family protein
MRDLKSWMWADALAMLDRAEQMHRQFFELGVSPHRAVATWQAPVDILLSEEALLLIVALPGVAPERIQIEYQENLVRVTGERTMPALAKQTQTLRFEIPHGVFERQIVLPEGRFRLESQQVRDGCLFLQFQRLVRS